MKYFDWNEKKNKLLRMERGFGFEDVLLAIEAGEILKIIQHPNKKKYPNQKIYLINIQNYVYLVPFIEDKEKIFLKTIIPSRKATEKYLVKKGGRK